MPRQNECFMPAKSRLRKAVRRAKRKVAIFSIEPSHKRRFQQRLLKWYRENGRDLPWRNTSNPYHILVSEVMLQQTQVDRVIPKYHEFLDRYPGFSELAAAPVEDVRKTWYPPKEPEQLLSFKGIGRYTAGAIRSFAFREAAPILDTNVMRVLHRVFVGKGQPKSQKTLLWKLSEDLIPRGKCYDFNQAIMDFGAMMCTARDPYCLLCPMKTVCKTYPYDGRRGG
jgi:A/G-specific adenine glycosylase